MLRLVVRFGLWLAAGLLALGLVVSPAQASGEPASVWSEADYAAVALASFRQDPRFLARIDLAAIDYPLLDAAVFFATNEIRVKQGLKPLAWSPALEQAALGHARRMAEKNFFNHTDPYDRSRASKEDRGHLAGIANPHLAENIAETFGLVYAAGKSIFPRGNGEFSYRDNGPLIPPHTYLSFADSVLDMWMHSSGHRANILSTNGLELGCGARLYANRSFYEMPMFKAVQNFQWFEKTKMKSDGE
jgi:uncharacterized protein YkwD